MSIVNLKSHQFDNQVGVCKWITPWVLIFYSLIFTKWPHRYVRNSFSCLPLILGQSQGCLSRLLRGVYAMTMRPMSQFQSASQRKPPASQQPPTDLAAALRPGPGSRGQSAAGSALPGPFSLDPAGQRSHPTDAGGPPVSLWAEERSLDQSCLCSHCRPGRQRLSYSNFFGINKKTKLPFSKVFKPLLVLFSHSQFWPFVSRKSVLATYEIIF